MLRESRAGTIVALLGAALCTFATRPAIADPGWFESGDTMLRMDLQLLNDAEIIRLPLNQWPLPRAAVQYALDNAKEHFATNAAVNAALGRVRARVAPAQKGSTRLEAIVNGGHAGLWRDFDTLAREDGEIGASANFNSQRFAVGLNVTAVANPDDGHTVRADGSHATVQLGNWLISANMLDRWWGPGHEGSLILSNNARPMLTIMAERAAAKPFESRWLSWLGPWRFSFGISQMENERADIDAPLFMAWRIEIMPFKDIELGFSRTAQFCGRQLECNLNVFGNLLAGNDNVGIDATPENEPGNQMAGFDIRWNSPIGNGPYAIYSQMIGEDESSYMPAKYIAQFGAEVWRPLAQGGLLQGFAEYSTTTCSANTSRGPYYNCAYNQGRFNVEGYRYLGRVIGYTADRDAENWSLGANYSSSDGVLWSATARRSRLNRDDFDDVHNSVASVPTDYNALDLGWKGGLFGEEFSVDLGVEAVKPANGEQDVSPFGFISWRHDFKP
ncbi:MAG TPA: capsule assembly Wzi family protein [Steroidobacteraceae bacterium]|nr:capsule assembly Wzi family protein [Steroidobacteraceae bacterium]